MMQSHCVWTPLDQVQVFMRSSKLVIWSASGVDVLTLSVCVRVCDVTFLQYVLICETPQFFRDLECSSLC